MVEQGDPNGILFPLHEWIGPAAERLADASGSLADMAFARACVEELLRSWPVDATEGPVGAVPRALWMAAIISYGRCFSSGVRRPEADLLVDGIADEARETHAYFMTLRDKHVAHSVNALEQTMVGVMLGDHPDYEPTGQIGTFSLIRVLEDRPTTTTFLQLASGLEGALTTQIENLQRAVVAEAHAMPPAERARRPEVKLQAPHPGAFAKSRKRKDRY